VTYEWRVRAEERCPDHPEVRYSYLRMSPMADTSMESTPDARLVDLEIVEHRWCSVARCGWNVWLSRPVEDVTVVEQEESR